MLPKFRPHELYNKFKLTNHDTHLLLFCYFGRNFASQENQEIDNKFIVTVRFSNYDDRDKKMCSINRFLNRKFINIDVNVIDLAEKDVIVNKHFYDCSDLLIE